MIIFRNKLFFENVCKYLDTNSKFQLKMSCRFFNNSIIIGDRNCVLYQISLRLCLFVFRLRILFDDEITVVYSPKNRNTWISFHDYTKNFQHEDQKTIVIDRVTGFIYLHCSNCIIGSLFQDDYFGCVDYEKKCFKKNINQHQISESICTSEPFRLWFLKQPYKSRYRSFSLIDITNIMRGHPEDWNIAFYASFFKTLKFYK